MPNTENIITTPYKVKADIKKWQGPIFNTTPSETYLKSKRRELIIRNKDKTLRFTDLVSVMDGYQKRFSEIKQILNLEFDSLLDFALSIEEDVAIIESGVLTDIVFCHPSNFIPATKVGLNFHDIHTPVADSQLLLAQSDKITEAIQKDGSIYKRHVWTLTTLGELSQHPDIIRTPAKSIEDIFFRKESQVTLGIKNKMALFLVKAEMKKFSDLDSETKVDIISSLESMTKETINYKGLQEIKKVLINE
jgi:hypothetical protein